jgi:putative transcriptional regulator
VAAIRARTRYRAGLYPYTQESFALAIGVPPGTVRQWEQKRRKPTGAARVLLALLDRNPDLIGQIAIQTNAQSVNPSVEAA